MTAADKEARTFTLLPGEDVLPDGYPVHVGYLYIADGAFRRCPLIDGTVAAWKSLEGLVEIRTCKPFDPSRTTARVGDRVIGPVAT